MRAAGALIVLACALVRLACNDGSARYAAKVRGDAAATGGAPGGGPLEADAAASPGGEGGPTVAPAGERPARVAAAGSGGAGGGASGRRRRGNGPMAAAPARSGRRGGRPPPDRPPRARRPPLPPDPALPRAARSRCWCSARRSSTATARSPPASSCCAISATRPTPSLPPGAEPGSRWTVTIAKEDLSEFTDDGLRPYAIIFWCNPTGTVFTAGGANGATGKLAVQRYLTSGGAWGGVHSATDFENTQGWTWFQDQVNGGNFVNHDADGTPNSIVWQPGPARPGSSGHPRHPQPLELRRRVVHA